jgi:hypothetical protein
MMIKFFKSLFGQQNRDSRQPEASVSVTFDDEGVRCTKPNSKEEHISWAKLDAVLIETNDQGPILPDVFWLLITKDMSSGCVIPQGAPGEDCLLEVLQKRLPGFNSEMVIKAMTSTDNQRFLVWER